MAGRFSFFLCSICFSQLSVDRYSRLETRHRNGDDIINCVPFLPSLPLSLPCPPQIGGNCRCAPCDFWCEDNGTLESHLLSTSHRDVVSMMNGSVPVVIGRQRALPCGGCDRRFRYNLQLRSHARETGHAVSYTASDEYQQRIRCAACPKIVRSLVALQRHQINCHVPAKDDGGKGENAAAAAAATARPAPYFCSFCSLNFATAQEAVLHRRTSGHKEVVKARKTQAGRSESRARECPHCAEKQPNLPAHKSHLLRCHAELCHR